MAALATLDPIVTAAVTARKRRKAADAVVEPTVDQIIDADFTLDEEVVQIDARSSYRPVHGYNDQGEIIEIGRVRYRDFESGKGIVRALTLESALTEKEHALGTPTRKSCARSFRPGSSRARSYTTRPARKR
jgi:hypothetical protein